MSPLTGSKKLKGVLCNQAPYRYTSCGIDPIESGMGPKKLQPINILHTTKSSKSNVMIHMLIHKKKLLQSGKILQIPYRSRKNPLETNVIGEIPESENDGSEDEDRNKLCLSNVD